MKTITFYLAAFAACFLLGFGLMLMSPTHVQAAESDCDPECKIEFCGQDPEQECEPYGQSMYYRCLSWYGLPCGERPYDCQCTQIGCGDECFRP